MRNPAFFPVLAAIATAVVSDSTLGAQSGSTLVAFRVDSTQLIATLKTVVHEMPPKQITEGLSAQPMASFGYQYFDLPPTWRPEGAPEVHAGDRWLIQTAPGEVFEASAERIVAGYAGCENAIGVLMKVVPEQSRRFAALPAKYFLAERAMTPRLSPTPAFGLAPADPKRNAGFHVGPASSPATVGFRQAVREALDSVLARELPQVIADAAPDLARAAKSDVEYLRSWARQRQDIDTAMQRGRSVLSYDVQSFHLSPDGVPVHFVRAQWRVQQRQGFAAAVWLRGDGPVEVIHTDLAPASWLRMSEFDGHVDRPNLGLILNTFDRNNDGWGDVLIAQAGYESMAISLLEYSPTGFHPAGVEFASGC